MKNFSQLIAALLLTTITFSQEKSFSGTIIDNLKNPVQYANIGILNKPIGTVTNDKGEFSFSLKWVMEIDTLKISCLGFKSKEIVIRDLHNLSEKFKISLDSYTETLHEVVVNKSNLKTYSDGKGKTETKQSVIFANPNYENINLGTEIGKKFSLGTTKPSLLKEFKFYIKDNNFEMVKFRINCYAISNNKPGNKINKSNITVQVDKKLTDWVIVDLLPFEISVQDDVIITVEWIEHSNDGNKLNLPIIIPSFGSTHYYKFGSQGNWQKYGKISSSMILTYMQ